MQKTAQVAVNIPLNKSIFTYLVPTNLLVQRGDFVKVPLGKRHEKGVIVEISEQDSEKEANFKLKEIHSNLIL